MLLRRDRIARFVLIGALAGMPLDLPAQARVSDSDARLVIRAVTVNGKSAPLRHHGSVSLGPSPRNVSFEFGLSGELAAPSVRVRYKLEGEDAGWRDGPGEMYLAVRFYNQAGDQIKQTTFTVMGESAGWKGTIAGSPLTHRREVVVVPEQAARLWVVLSSAGPPQTVGIYVVANLTVNRFAGTSQPALLMESPLERGFDDKVERNPPGWTRDGNHSSMAKIVTLSENPVQKAFAIVDDDGGSHAEWHNVMESAPAVVPGEQVVVEWNEMFSIGLGSSVVAHYDALKEGTYRFRMAEFDILGGAMSHEKVLAVVVPLSFWQTPSFWSFTAMSLIILSFVVARYLMWRRMRLEVLRLKEQQVLEQERLRIAQNIHDDLGARVTEISLISAMARTKASFPQSASVDFERISSLSRELVSALYETVWTVNPENDNLDALGNYVCQITNKLCEQAQLPCRFQISELPSTIQVSSQIRHNLIMAVKEAVHNIIKHAQASEVTLSAAYEDRTLVIAIRDNGCGFAADDRRAGNGLTNIRRRLESLGGRCLIESAVGTGTRVELRLGVPPPPR